MQIELTPEIEDFLQAESSATGLAPAEIALRLLADCAGSHHIPVGRIVTPEDFTVVEPIPEEVMKERRAAVARIIARQQAPNAPRFDVPEGVSLRQWLCHSDHRYKD
jgi:hypothetical protein